MFGIGPMELLVVAGVTLLIFGKRLPGVMKSLGKGISEFRNEIEERK